MSASNTQAVPRAAEPCLPTSLGSGADQVMRWGSRCSALRDTGPDTCVLPECAPEDVSQQHPEGSLGTWSRAGDTATEAAGPGQNMLGRRHLLVGQAGSSTSPFLTVTPGPRPSPLLCGWHFQQGLRCANSLMPTVTRTEQAQNRN